MRKEKNVTQEEKLAYAKELNEKFHMGKISLKEKNIYSQWNALENKKNKEGKNDR